VQVLRDQLSQDTSILASLDPKSQAHRRFSARIERQTTELLDREELRERRERARRLVPAEQQRRHHEACVRLVGWPWRRSAA
jgi:hypothetical protein